MVARSVSVSTSDANLTITLSKRFIPLELDAMKMGAKFMEMSTYQLRSMRTEHVIRVEPGQTVTVGRSTRADYQLDRSNVARQHLRLSNRGGSLFLEDLRPTNYLILNGVVFPRGETRELSPGDSLDFCGYEFLIETVSP